MIVEEDFNMITSLYLMPTLNCNSLCEYCYIKHQQNKVADNDQLMQSVVENYIQHAKKNLPIMVNPQIRFIGGEPYLKKQILHQLISSFLSEIKNGKVYINTNGTLLNENDIGSYTNNGNQEKVIHIVSLDGLEKIHNHRRKLHNNTNAFKAVTHGIRLLKSKKMPVYVNMVLDAFSFSGFEEFLLFVKKDLGLTELSVSLLQSSDNGMQENEKFNLLENAYELAHKHNMLLGGHHRLLLGHKIEGLRCKAGKKSMLVTPNGKISACQRFVNNFSENNCFTDNISFQQCDLSEMVNLRCYNNHNLEIGNSLYNLYEKKYPEYKKVNQLDRELFGVI